MVKERVSINIVACIQQTQPLVQLWNTITTIIVVAAAVA